MSLKLVVVALWAVFLFTDEAQAVNPNIFKSVVSLQVLCTSGGPEILMEELLEGYNEKPVHGMDISTDSGLNIQMYITENKNNPSSTVLLHNQNVDKTCIFWSAKDYIRTLETESLPAKKPTDGEGT
jgi:hypothetical protein|tara:strand:+ start:5955 stop:6335 length:381 start_codon:yes stop_codon:yes gene_type:complete